MNELCTVVIVKSSWVHGVISQNKIFFIVLQEGIFLLRHDRYIQLHEPCKTKYMTEDSREKSHQSKLKYSMAGFNAGPPQGLNFNKIHFFVFALFPVTQFVLMILWSTDDEMTSSLHDFSFLEWWSPLFFTSAEVYGVCLGSIWLHSNLISGHCILLNNIAIYLIYSLIFVFSLL